MAKSSPSRNRLKRRASERSSGIWKRRLSAETMHGGRNPGTAAMAMTEDAKTEKYTAGSPCGAYIRQKNAPQDPVPINNMQNASCNDHSNVLESL